MTQRSEHPANEPVRRAAPLPRDLQDVASIDAALGDLLAGELTRGALKSPPGFRDRVFEASVEHLPEAAPLVFTTAPTWRSRFAGAGRFALAASVGLAALVAVTLGPSGPGGLTDGLADADASEPGLRDHVAELVHATLGDGEVTMVASANDRWASDHVIEFLLREQSRYDVHDADASAELYGLDAADQAVVRADAMGYLSRSGDVGLDSVVSELDQIWGELEG